MDKQFNSTQSTSVSNLFDSQPQQVKDLLKGLHQGNITLLVASTQQTMYKEKNMAQGPYIEEIPTSRESSYSGHYSSTGTSADSLYGSKTYGDSMYGSESYGDSAYGSKAYSQQDCHDAHVGGTGGEIGGQGYNGSIVERGLGETSQSYYDGASFQEGNIQMITYPGYDDSYSSMLGGGRGTSGQGYNDSSIAGRGQGFDGNTRGRGRGTSGQGYNDSSIAGRGQGFDGNTRGRGRGTRGQGFDGNIRGSGQGFDGGFMGRVEWTRGKMSDSSARGRGRGSGGQIYDGSARGRGRGSESSVWGKGQGSRGQGSDSSVWGNQGTRGQGYGVRGKGRGTRGQGSDGNANRGRESAKRGMPLGGRGNGPTAKKARWQNEQQGYGEAGSGERSWGADQGWFVRSKEHNSSQGKRGRGKEQSGRGRGSRGHQGGQRNDPSRSNQESDGSAVEYGFDGKLVGPERFSDTYGAYKHCKVCDVHINSIICAKDHYSGKNHLKKLDAMLKKEELIKTSDVYSDKCEVCNVVYTSPDQVKSHLNGGRHKRNVEEAQAKAEGRTLPPDPRKQKKQEGDKETIAAVRTETTLSGELPSSELLGLEHTDKVAEPLMKVSGEISHVDSRPRDMAQKHSEGAPHKQNIKEGHEDSKLQGEKKKREPTDAERAAGGMHRRLFHCDICSISTTAPEHLAAHFVGKKHKAMMESIEKKNSMCTTTGANVFSCKLCGISATDTYSLNLHLIGKKHSANLGKSEYAPKKNVPEPMMASASHPSSKQETEPPEPLQRPPSPPASQQLFESEEVLDEEFLLEQNYVSKTSQDDITSAINQSLQDATSDMPELAF